MSKISDEILMAYADGELAPKETAELEVVLKKDATLRMRLEPFVVTRRKLVDTFESTLGEPIPDHLVSAILRAPAPTQPSRAASGARGIQRALEAFAATIFPGGLSLATAASIALMMSVGAAGGWLAARETAPAATGLIAANGPGLAASGALAAALERAPSAAPSANGNGQEQAAIVPINTFRTKEENLCREYRIQGASGQGGYAGLACRTDEGTWRLAVHVATPKPVVSVDRSSLPHETAATGLSVPAVDEVVDSIKDGDVLGPEEERALRESGWRTVRIEPASR